MKSERTSQLIVMGLTITVALSILFGSCSNGITNTENDEAKTLFEENPVTIVWNDSVSGEVYGFQANVEVYGMNNRKDSGPSLQDTYRVMSKKINGIQHLRLDFSPETNDGRARSLVTDGKEMVIFDRSTGETEQRMALTDSIPDALRFLDPETVFTRMNLDRIRSESARMAFDIQDDTETSSMLISLPSTFFANEYGQQRTSTKIRFDTLEDTLSEIELIDILEDGTVITSTTNPVYQDQDGIPVKVGSITMIQSDNPNLIEGFAEDTPIYESYDDIPTLTQDELELLQSEGSISPAPDPVFGDPADLSNVQTVIEVYQEIEINETPDSAFKMLWEAGK